MKAGLQNEELLTMMFEDIRNSGSDHWSVGMGTMPTVDIDAINIDDDNDKDSEPEDEPLSQKRKRGKVDKPKKNKGGSERLIDEMSRTADISEQTLSSIQSFAKQREDPPGCSIKDVMALVEECGATEGTNEHFIATEIFIKKEQREMFVNSLHTATGRFNWLTKKYEVKYGK